LRGAAARAAAPSAERYKRVRQQNADPNCNLVGR
jgi:hypothetical protein